MKVRRGLMSRKMIPYMQSFSIMSSRSSPASAAISGQPHIPAQLMRNVIQRGPHQPEVLPGRVRSREPLPGGALGHVVEQRLAGGADHRDDVGPFPRRRLGLRDVLVDVAGRHDEVDPRLGRVGGGADHRGPLGPAGVDPGEAPGERRGGRRPGRVRVGALGQPELPLARGGVASQRGQAGIATGDQRVPRGQRHPVLQAAPVGHGIDEVVHPRHAVLRVGAVEAAEPQHRPFHRHRGVRAGHLHDGLARDGGQLPRLADDLGVQPERGHRVPGLDVATRHDRHLPPSGSQRSAAPRARRGSGPARGRRALVHTRCR